MTPHLAPSPDPVLEAARARSRTTAAGPVVFLCPTGWGLRNVVASGLLEEVRDGGRAVRVLCTAAADNALADPWADGDPDVRGVMQAPPRHAVWARVRELEGEVLRATYARRHRLSTYDILDRWQRRHEGWPGRMKSAVLRAAGAVAAVGSLYPRLLHWDELLADHSDDATAIRAQLRALAPSLVVASSCVVRDEHPYLRVAREEGIRTLGCVLSFDNVTSRGLLPACDHYAVWGPQMRDEVLAMRPGARANTVHVTGTPQFDFHVRPDARWTRARLLDSLGLAPSARYLLWAANARQFTPEEPALVERVARELRRVPRLAEHHVVVRLHPADAPERWSALVARTDSPDHVGVRLLPTTGAMRVGSAEGQQWLVNLLRHADACLNTASTMSLDAAVVDTPIVCVGVGDGAGGTLDRFARECHETTHFAPIMASGGVRLAASIEELIGEVAAYVDDPARDRDGRAGLVAQLCGPVDGAAASRLGALITRLSAAPSQDPQRTT